MSDRESWLIASEILKERDRQLAIGYTTEHDDRHSVKQILSYAKDRIDGFKYGYDTPEEDRKALVQAAAVIMAAIERLDRAAR